MVLGVDQMLNMSQAELDQLYRESPAGTIPRGEGRGTVILDPDTDLADIAARVVRFVAWQGKVFDPDKGELRNRILPSGLNAVVAKVFKGPSWFDGQECIILDYADTSLIAHWIRDEIREIAPGLYLGIVYWDETRLFNFALEFPAAQATSQPPAA